MNTLTKYDAAKYALQAAITVDEVKDIRDKSEAMAAYARQAKDVELIKWATEIKVRAERKAGQILADMPKAQGELKNSSRYYDVTATKTLSEIGITKNESSRWQKLAAITDSQFEQAVASAKEVAGEVTTAALIRYEKSLHTETLKPKPIPKIDPVSTAVKQMATKPPAKESSPEDDYTEIDQLRDDNSELRDVILDLHNQISIGNYDGAEPIEDILKELRITKANLKQVTISRDSLMNELNSAKRQIIAQRKEIDKLKK